MSCPISKCVQTIGFFLMCLNVLNTVKQLSFIFLPWNPVIDLRTPGTQDSRLPPLYPIRPLIFEVGRSGAQDTP